jgi:hypothetical protein
MSLEEHTAVIFRAEVRSIRKWLVYMEFGEWSDHMASWPRSPPQTFLHCFKTCLMDVLSASHPLFCLRLHCGVHRPAEAIAYLSQIGEVDGSSGTVWLHDLIAKVSQVNTVWQTTEGWEYLPGKQHVRSACNHNFMKYTCCQLSICKTVLMDAHWCSPLDRDVHGGMILKLKQGIGLRFKPNWTSELRNQSNRSFAKPHESTCHFRENKKTF